jgi:ribosomal protein S18 acetylase RimI-like enzyme
MDYQIRAATAEDIEPMLSLFPRLADFDLPPERTAAHLWRDDAELLRRWGSGQAPNCLVWVAVDPDNVVLGVALVQLRPELLSHEPSAHLEVLVVDRPAEGNGIGQALIQQAEKSVRDHGGLSMTLHVFAANARARQVYERLGYTGELIRYIKYLDT